VKSSDNDHKSSRGEGYGILLWRCSVQQYGSVGIWKKGDDDEEEEKELYMGVRMKGRVLIGRVLYEE